MQENLERCRVFTLREMLGSQTKILGDIEILNECNETLVRLADTDEYVCSLTKILSSELLDRIVLSYGSTLGSAFTFIVKGVEDAE